MFISINLLSQVGKDCQNAYLINSLPFYLNNQTTQGMGNDYNETMACNSLYMTGNDFVFKYIPQNDIKINIKLTNTNVLVGLFLLDGCPDQPSTQCIAKVEASNGNPQISNVLLNANTEYYIIIDTYNAANLFPNTTFNISVTEAYTIDIAPKDFYRPLSGCHLNSSAPICIRTRNEGINPVDTTILAFQIDNQPPIIDTFVYHLVPGDYGYFWFSNTLDLSQVGKHLMIAYSLTPNDDNKINDTIKRWVIHPPSVSSFPYFEDFENDDGGWAANWLSDISPGLSWEWGIPQGQVINYTVNGYKCWATNLSGNYLPSESSYILSPCFDFSQLVLPVIEFDIFYSTAITDIIQLEYSLDSGSTWQQVGNPGEGINWYNTPSGYNMAGWNGNSNGWLHAMHTLDGLGGKSYVLLRISLRAGVTEVAEGVAIDNVRISESPQYDLAISQVKYPYDSCGLGNNEKFIFSVTNNGLQTIQNFNVKISTDNGQTFITETINQPIAFQQTVQCTTATNFNLSNYGLYNAIIILDLPNDENKLNDTIRKKIMNFPIINSFPYLEDFEIDNGYWYSTGTNSSWQWGMPVDTVLTSAGSGNKCWATNLTGYHNLAEESYVYSPCFIIDSLQKPLFKSLVWYEQTYPTYTQLQYKIGHSIWDVLGSVNSPNWYNSGYSWINSSNGWQEVKHLLTNLGTGSNLQLRFYFKGTIQNTGFAFDRVEICDAPNADFTTYIPEKGGYYVYFKNLSQRYDSCLWYFGDGYTSYEKNPIHQYPNADSVLVKLVVWNNCSKDSISKYVKPIYINVPENGLSQCYEVFYNNNTLYIQDNCYNNSKVYLEVYDIRGLKLFDDSLKIDKQATITITFKDFGIYLLKLSSDKLVVTKKLIYIK